MICHGNGFTSWLLFREKQAYHVWGPLPLSTSSQLAETKVTTNLEYLKQGVEINSANAILWKFNQVGTITEALDAADYAYRSGYGVQVSERSGETEDTSIADLSVALNCGQIKTGTTRSERTGKYNQLIRIAEELGSEAVYPGRNFRKPY
jgi:enolase